MFPPRRIMMVKEANAPPAALREYKLWSRNLALIISLLAVFHNSFLRTTGIPLNCCKNSIKSDEREADVTPLPRYVLEAVAWPVRET
jgi:hypothetical protein